MLRECVLLFTDAVDSTRITEQLGDMAASALWAEHDRIARALLRRWQGREIDKSDGFLLLFEGVDGAVGYALALHRALAALTPPISSRAGIHIGPMVTRENSAEDLRLGAKPLELDGVGKALAARIMNLARGGQTLLSAAAHAALDTKPWRLQSHGHWRMKGLAEPVELFEAGDGDAPFAPPPDSPKAYRVLKSDGGWKPMARLRHGLPAERDGFVGRGDALKALAARFDHGARLVTLLGIGGIGKTRLALRYAHDWLGDYPGGAWFCDLSSARSVDGIVHAMAQGLDVPLGKADPVQQLGAAIAGRGECLVILDNFEQVVRHADETVGQWLDQAPQARLLATSREVMGITGEENFVLAPLAGDEAVHLFERRAAAADGRWSPSGPERAALPQLVKMLDCLPLAIELAAARIRIMGPTSMLEHMGERFKLLASRGGRRDRQATLRAALDWSWDLLSDVEQQALLQLSVFESGFTLEAAEAVVDLSNIGNARWIGDVVQTLVEKSLVITTKTRRFLFLRTVLDYLIDRREPLSGDRPAALVVDAIARHSHYFAGIGESDAVRDRCADIDNLMLACLRALPSHVGLAVRALRNLWTALRMSGPFRAVDPALKAVEAAGPSEPSHIAAVAWVAAGVLHQNGSLSLALERGHEGLKLELADLRPRPELARMHLVVADILRSLGRLRESGEQAQRALQTAQACGDQLGMLQALNSLGALHYAAGHNDLARQCYEQGLLLARQAGHQQWIGGLLGNLASLSYTEGHWQESLLYYEEALALAEAIGDRQWEGNNRSNFALLQHELGQSLSAFEQLTKALSIAREIGHGRLERFALCNLGIIHAALNRQPEAVRSFEAAIELCARNADRHAENTFRGYLALTLARNGQAKRAGVELQAALASMREMDDPPATLLLLSQGALVAALLAQTSWAQACLDDAERLQVASQIGHNAECDQLCAEARSVLAQG